MNDSRSISKFMKSTSKGVYSVEFLDWLKTNTFLMSKNGKIQSTVHGTGSSIIIRIAAFISGRPTIIDYPIHPNRLLAIGEMIFSNNLELLEQSTEGNLKGFINKKIKKDKKKGDKFEAYLTNIYISTNDQQEKSLIFFNKEGNAEFNKTGTNSYDFDLNTFEKEKSLGVSIPLMDAYTLFLDLKRYVANYESIFFSGMLNGRHNYEENCKTIFKSCKGDVERIREIEIKMAKTIEKDVSPESTDEPV